MSLKRILERYEALGSKLHKTGELSPSEWTEIDKLATDSQRMSGGAKSASPEPAPVPVPAKVVQFIPKWQSKREERPQFNPPPPERRPEPRPAPDVDAIVRTLRSEIATLRQQPPQVTHEPRSAPSYKLVVHRSADDLIRSISVEPVE